MNNDFIIKIQNIKKKINNYYILNNININIKKKEIIAIVGPSGSGKSTLLRLINLLDKPTSGKIFFNNKNILDNNININYYRRKVGMVFQQYNLFKNMTIKENIILAPIKLNIMTKTQALKKANKLLSKVNLLKKANEYPCTLSGGQQQRIAIIRSLIMSPEIILFDEPTSSLDLKMTYKIMKLIKKLSKFNITSVIVTHEIELVKNIASKIIFIDNGKIKKEIIKNI